MGYLLISFLAVFFIFPIWVLFPIGFLSWTFPNLLPRFMELPKRFRIPLLLYVTAWLCVYPIVTGAKLSPIYIFIVSSIFWCLAAGWVESKPLKVIFTILFFLSLYGYPTNELKNWRTESHVLSTSYIDDPDKCLWT